MKHELTPDEVLVLRTMLIVGTQVVQCLDLIEQCIRAQLEIPESCEAGDIVTDAIHLGLRPSELLERLHIRVLHPC
jgi:hypothetical protein